jgi:hypothetical protein
MLPIREIYVNLDDPIPKAQYVDQNGNRQDIFAFSLTPGEAERFLLHITGTNAVYQWTATMELLDGTRHRTVPVTKGDRPVTLLPRAIGPEIR